MVTAATFTQANINERDVCPELTEDIKGLLLGDKGFIRPKLYEELKKRGLHLETPLRDNIDDKRPKIFSRWMMGTQRLIETVIGQLTEWLHIEKIRARDLWHRFSRFWSKLLAHTVCIKLSLATGNEPPSSSALSVINYVQFSARKTRTSRSLIKYRAYFLSGL